MDHKPAKVEVDAQGALATPALLEPAPKTYTKRNHLLCGLVDRNAKEAVARQRSSPYGHG